MRSSFFWKLLPLLLLLSACDLVRYVPDDRLYLKREPKVKGNQAVSSSDILGAMRTHENRRMLMGPKTFLYLYNIGRTIQDDESLLKKYLMRRETVREYYYPLLTKALVQDLGEPPVLIDPEVLRKDSINIRNLYFSRGYFHPKISIQVKEIDNIFTYNQAKVFVTVEEDTAYKIGSMNYRIQDSAVKSVVLRNVKNALVYSGQNYNHDNMDAERSRISNLMRENGFFKFSPGLVRFEADTTNRFSSLPVRGKQKYISLTMVIDEMPLQYRIGEVKDSILSAFATIEDLFADFRSDKLTPEKRRDLELPDHQLLDTTLKVRYRVSRDLMSDLNFDFIGRRIRLKEGELYARSHALKTQRSLQSLTMFQYVTMTYQPNDSLRTIDVKITNKLSPRRQLKAGAESFTNVVNDNATAGSNFNMSLGANVTLRDKNAFSRSEQTELSLAALAGLYQAVDSTIRLLYEVRAKASIDYPRFIFPVKRWNQLDFSMNDPKTNLVASVRIESRQEYRRVTLSSNFSYRWYHIPFSTVEASQFTPLALDVISIPNGSISQAFQEQLDKFPILKRDFNPRFSSRMLYNYTWTNYMTKRKQPTVFGRLGFEEGGTLPFVIDLLTQGDKIDSTYKDHTLFNRTNTPIDYGRFVKLSGEGKLYVPLWENAAFVFRSFVGAGIKLPYTPYLPLQNRFYGGGTNSMRGWRSNTLGPGITPPTTTNILPYGGDYALEMNAELRFKAWSYLNLALFSDLGNVWFSDNARVREAFGDGAGLNRQNFRLGWDVGVGARFDFSFLILRLDFAQQWYVPYLKSYIWQAPPDAFLNSFNTNIGIGYPF